MKKVSLPQESWHGFKNVHCPYLQDELTRSSSFLIRLFIARTTRFQYLGVRIRTSSMDNSSPCSSTSSPEKTNLLLDFFFAASALPAGGAISGADEPKLVEIFKMDGFPDDALPMAVAEGTPFPPASPTDDATASSALGAAGCGIIKSLFGGGGKGKLGGNPWGGIPGGRGNDIPGGNPGGSPGGNGGTVPGGNPNGNGGGGGGGGGMGAKPMAPELCNGSSVKQSSVKAKSS